jgi:hypothetical protein
VQVKGDFVAEAVRHPPDEGKAAQERTCNCPIWNRQMTAINRH